MLNGRLDSAHPARNRFSTHSLSKSNGKLNLLALADARDTNVHALPLNVDNHELVNALALSLLAIRHAVLAAFFSAGLLSHHVR
jgi:hypothetical protein